MGLWYREQGKGFGVVRLRFRTLGSRVCDQGFRMKDLGFRAWGLGSRVWGLRLVVDNLRLMVHGERGKIYIWFRAKSLGCRA